MTNDTLLAIPFFTFMGLILERSGMAEDLLETIGQLFGPVRGGLAFAVIVVGALLAATTGVVAASVISMGLISLPIMLRYGYDRRFATGVIAASGTLAQIIPPSLVLIVMADQLGRSVGDMYEGALIPGLILSSIYILYAAGVTMVFPKAAPALPLEARAMREPSGASGIVSFLVLFAVTVVITILADRYLAPRIPESASIVAVSIAVLAAFVAALLNHFLKLGILSQLAERVVFVLIPPLALIFLVLGTIFLGIATPTEGGAMGASGALLLAFFKRRLNFGMLSQAIDSTAKLSSFVIFILLGARVFSLTFYGVNGHVWVEHLLVSLPGGEVGFLLVVNLIVFVLAFFLDFFELAFIIIPLLGPAAEKLGIDLIWFGVIMAVNMQTSFMHPPFGFALFYLRSVAPKESLPRQAHRQAHGAGDDGRDLLGCRAVRLHPGHHGAARRLLPEDGNPLQGQRQHREPGHHPAARHPAAAAAAAASRPRPAQAPIAPADAATAKKRPRHARRAGALREEAGLVWSAQPRGRARTIEMS